MSKYRKRAERKLKKARGFGSLRIVQRLPDKSRRRCDTVKLQEAAVRGTMNAERMDMQEEVVVLLLDDHQQLIAGVPLYVGTSDAVNMDFADVIRLAVFGRAYYVLVAHNHPDGKVQPSDADQDAAIGLWHALRISHLELLDFVTVTRKRYYSFQENGLIRH